MNRIVYTRPDGGVSVVIPASEDADMKQLLKSVVPPDAIAPAIVDASVLPADRTFRGAWKAGKDSVVIDMAKAREIQRDRIRQARVPMFAELDAEFSRALGRKDEAEADSIEARRQVLRDAPADPRIDSAQTPDDLTAIKLPD